MFFVHTHASTVRALFLAASFSAASCASSEDYCEASMILAKTTHRPFSCLGGTLSYADTSEGLLLICSCNNESK
jgi:hypothetical protein